MKLFKFLTFAVLLAGCNATDVARLDEGQTGQNGETLLYAQALYGEPVFDNDVVSFSQSLSNAVGGISKQWLLGFISPKLMDPSVGLMQQSIAQIAEHTVDGRDLAVVMLTTHGAPDLLAYKAPSKSATAWKAGDISQFLAPLENDFNVVVVQACFSGSLIDELAHPNRIIITAAAADRTSFGCAPKNDNTWFIESLNAAMSQGGTWEQVVARAHAIVRMKEKAQGVPAAEFSNPQYNVGRNMRRIWHSSL